MSISFGVKRLLWIDTVNQLYYKGIEKAAEELAQKNLRFPILFEILECLEPLTNQPDDQQLQGKQKEEADLIDETVSKFREIVEAAQERNLVPMELSESEQKKLNQEHQDFLLKPIEEQEKILGHKLIY